MKRVVIIASSESYRVGDFLKAASLLHIDVVVATDAESPLKGEKQIRVELNNPDAAAAAIETINPQPNAVIAVDDQGVIIAAEANARLGLIHNDLEAVEATRNKLKMRELLATAKVPQPAYRSARFGQVPHRASELGYPVVIKPQSLSGSRGVIRANSPDEAREAEDRIREILVASGCHSDERLLVEKYVGGIEIAIEGLLTDNHLNVLAVIDKPDPLEGPFFEETLYITPSRLRQEEQETAIDLAGRAARALGLHTGPIHAEIRITPKGTAAVIEVAARSIGGLCGRALTFGQPRESLEVMILRGALGLPTVDTSLSKPASGVLMLPIPATGILTDVEEIQNALEVDGINDIEITIPIGRQVVALPEGDRYLGFIFASGADPTSVETALREAGNILTVAIDGEYINPPVAAEDPK